MPLSFLILLSGIQGISEFLPISSSGHLVLVAEFLEIKGRSLTFDVAMHIGSLGAVLFYLWRDMAFMGYGVLIALTGRRSPGARLLALLIIGSIPIFIVGYLFNYFFPLGITDVQVIAWMTLIFGVVLVVADKIGMTVRRIEHLNFTDMFFIGIFQVVALVPGTSRSGICMTVARILGMERSAAARLSLLLGIPVILGAGGLKLQELSQLGDVALTNDILVAVGLSFAFALVSIWGMMAWLQRASFTPFAIYRVFLGSVILFSYYGWIS